MVIPANPNVHMEDVEETEVEDEVSDETGDTGVLCSHGGKSRRGYWFTSATSTANRALSKEILVRKGFYDLADAYQQMHVNY